MTGRRHFLPQEDLLAAWLDAWLVGCSPQFDSFSLPGELQPVVVCSSSAVRGTSGVWGGKRREGNSQMLCWALPVGFPVPDGLHGRISTANPQTLSPCRTALRDVPSRPLGLPSSYHHCQKPPWALSLQIRTNFSLLPSLRPGVSLPVLLARPPSGGLCRKGGSFVGGQALAFVWPDLPWVTCSQSCVASLALLPQVHRGQPLALPHGVLPRVLLSIVVHVFLLPSLCPLVIRPQEGRRAQKNLCRDPG